VIFNRNNLNSPGKTKCGGWGLIFPFNDKTRHHAHGLKVGEVR
jgi:hypothetical protein